MKEGCFPHFLLPFFYYSDSLIPFPDFVAGVGKVLYSCYTNFRVLQG